MIIEASALQATKKQCQSTVVVMCSWTMYHQW